MDMRTKIIAGFVILNGLLLFPFWASTAHAQTELKVFVTAATYGGQTFGGAGGADILCQDLADTAALGGRYRAWISEDYSTAEPLDRFNHGTSIPFKLLDGTTIADDWADLTDGSLDNPINRDQNNSAVASGQEVWTNVLTSGAHDGAFDCDGWTYSGASGYRGEVGQVDSNWTDKSGTATCSIPKRLYCFQQMNETAPAEYKRVFLTASTYTAGASFKGQGEADVKCQLEADAASLPGAYKAWMSTDGASTAPQNIFTQSPYPYMSTSGYKIADDWADLVDGGLDYPIVHDASGNHISGVQYVYTNVLTSGNNDGANDCTDWTNNGASSTRGIAAQLASDWTDLSGTESCNVPKRLYCFEQDPANGPTPISMGCSNPDAQEGDIIYNGDDHVAQYCNGTGWVAMGPPGDGGGGCSDPAGTAGDMIYNDDDAVLQYCEGDTWIKVGK